ncbi:MAG: T9SS type A sorting domain-containing protein, partial [Rhodothermales bacterium]|nr:T9SS type A sorting domain-containing protein [Rhodothermales bacterium]
EFGLRDATLVDSVLIEWPSGITDIYTDVEVNTFYDAVEGQELSPASSSTSALSETTQRGVIGLDDNFPDPFSQTTTISYDLSRPAKVTLAVYDVLGRNLRVLVSSRQPAGEYEVSLDASHLTSGVYFYHLQAGPYLKTKRMVVVR